ncbi:EmrA/EmrK family multidrug efflux transporter periplasmic adaptor subunit (plasmid) [Ralstonia solanacearum]|uniref:HlyD family secretion protein n=1 Tax=Ralstonia pseudosolanacearum TaxID=1310165 RepID=UPI000C9F2815|nr:HlyD family secretion protein [Ralstonia pseudosolanacearum]AUS44921.1 EmrA/EmrK family multidrug efflux transporter periplasmic adaptor subunit [Ralstonia solanacearum]
MSDNTPQAAPSAAPAPAAPAAIPNGSGNGKRKRMLTTLAAALVVAGVGYGLYWGLYGRWFESTDDAYVQGNVVQVTPQVAGTVVAIRADDTQLVTAGQPLIELDRADARVALEQAEAALAQAVRQVRTLYSNTGAVSQEEIAHAQTSLQAAEAAVETAREQLQANRMLTEQTTLERHPNVLQAAAKVREAYLAYARTSLPASVTGYVAKRSVQVGQRVAPGTPLMAIVPLDQLWVDANFKEVQVRHMRVGQPVELVADVYGSSVTYHGKVVGFSAGTGSAFSLLPAQNATGNWIKVVQRLPVRVSLDPKELKDHPLRVGLSMEARVDIHDEGGQSLASTPATPPLQTSVYDQAGQEADQVIASIIATNAGRGTASAPAGAGAIAPASSSRAAQPAPKA